MTFLIQDNTGKLHEMTEEEATTILNLVRLGKLNNKVNNWNYNVQISFENGIIFNDLPKRVQKAILSHVTTSSTAFNSKRSIKLHEKQKIPLEALKTLKSEIKSDSKGFYTEINYNLTLSISFNS